MLAFQEAYFPLALRVIVTLQRDEAQGHKLLQKGSVKVTSLIREVLVDTRPSARFRANALTSLRRA